MGGNLSFAEPHADPGVLLLALDAKVVAQGSSAEREISMGDFFVDAYETSLQADEILTEIRVPVPEPRSAVRYLKFGYLQRPSVGVALQVSLADGDSIRDARVAVGCAGPKPRRVEDAEALLKGKSLREASRTVDEAGRVAGRAAEAIGDLHGSVEYKEHIVGVLLKRSLQRIIEDDFSAKNGGGTHA